MILFCTKTTSYCTSSDGNRKSVVLTDVYWRILLFCLHSNLLSKKKKKRIIFSGKTAWFLHTLPLAETGEGGSTCTHFLLRF